MIADNRLALPPRKKYLRYPNNDRRAYQPIEVVMPAGVQNFANEVIPIARISTPDYFNIFFQ